MSPRGGVALLVLLTAAAVSRADEVPLPLPMPATVRPPQEEERPPPVALSLLSGAASALLPLAVGGAMVSTGGSQAERNAGVLVIVFGLSLSPFLSHALAGEWKRAAAFTAVPLLSAVAMVVMLQTVPDVIDALGEPASRFPFAIILIASAFSTGLGLVDSMLSGERHGARVKSKKKPAGAGFLLAPTFGQGRAGLAMGGVW